MNARGGGWGPTLAIIGGLAAVGLGFVLVPRLLLPAPASESAPPASSSVEPLPTANVSFTAGPYLGVEWQLTTIPADRDAYAWALAEIDGRLVAVGTSPDATAAWWSDDGGQTWRPGAIEAPTTPPTETARTRPRSLAVGPDGLLATGWWTDQQGEANAILSSAAWASADGRAWFDAPLTGLDETILDAVFGTPTGFYATGFSEVRGESWWHSDDGQAWSPIEPTGINQLMYFPPGVARQGFVNLIVNGGLKGASSRPAIYLSTNWLDWDHVYQGEERGYGLARDVAAFDQGFIAVGQTWDDPDRQNQDGTFTAWVSNDGYAWQQLTVDAPPGTVGDGIAANADGAVAIVDSMRGTGSDAWYLPHGGTPTTVPLPFRVQDIVALPDRFVAVGYCAPVSCGIVVAIGTPTASTATTAPTLPPLPD